MSKLYVDTVSMSRSTSGMKYLLTVEDGFTRFLMAFPVPNKNAETLAKVIMEKVIPVLGIPQQIHSDNGLEFANRVWDSMCALLHINHTYTPVYNPSSNIVERAHRTLGELFRTSQEDMINVCDHHVGAAVFVYNTTVHSSTGTTPYEAMYGRAPTLPIDLVYPVPELEAQSFHQYIAFRHAVLQDMYKEMAK